jgi:hypothetical protein
VPYFLKGSVAFSFRSENCVSPRRQVSELKSSFSRCFLRFPVSFWKEKKIANIVCEALGFKRKQKRRVFRLCYNNLILIPRQLFKITIVVHVNGLKSFKKIVKLKIKKLEWKKSFVWMFRIDLKKITSKQKKLLRQKQFTHQSDSESLRSFNEKKNKTTSDSRAAISFSAPPKWRKINKKNRNRKRFSCFFNNTTKGRTFQFLMTISNARSPTLPPS